MPSVSNQSSTTDAQDVESTYDRYSVTHGAHRIKDVEVSNTHKSVSFGHLSVASSSFDSRTYGTSYVSDGSETLERDEFFDDEEFLDLENFSLESQPMVMDRFVDSACSCLDHPAALYQKICLGAETSLLRQSKVRSPSTNFQNKPTSPNLGMAAAKRRSHLVRANNAYSNGERELTEQIAKIEKRNEIQIMRIQPEDVSELKDVVRPKTQNSDNHNKRIEEKQAAVGLDSLQKITIHQPVPIHESRQEYTTERKEIDQKKEANEESQSISNDSTKSMVERAIQKGSKEDEERGMDLRRLETAKDIDAGLSEIAEKMDVDVKIDPPSDIRTAAIRDGQSTGSYPESLQELESSKSDEATKGVSKQNEKLIEVAMDPSGRGQRSQSPTVTTQRATEVASQSSNVTSRTKEAEIDSDDETSIFNDLEVVDVLSMDDQDSWIPGSRNEIDNLNTMNKDELDHQNQNSMLPGSKLSSSSTDDQVQRDRPVITNVSSVDELWVEEEEKLNRNNPSSGAKSSRSNVRIVTQTAEDLWNEERMKLQTNANGIFDDSKVMEAFLRQDQVNFRDTRIDAREILRSQSRRQRIRKALKDRDGEDFLTYKTSQENLRLKTLGQSPPTPESLSAIQQSPNDGLEGSLAGNTIPFQPSVRELSNVTPLPSRKKDLVAVRSIEEGQRIRSSKRNAPKKYDTHPYHKPSMEMNSYARERTARSPYEEQSNRSRRHTKSNSLIKSSSRQLSRTPDPNGTKHLTMFEEPAKNYQTNDERDDQESLPSSNPAVGRPASITSENKLSDFEIAVSATKELRKLEKKIERQLRRADLDSKTDQSKEIRRIEKKLSKKLRSIKPDDMEGQAVSSREIRRLEKELAQRLSGENEKRASKLKRIKRKPGSTARGLPLLSMKFKEEKEFSGKARLYYSGQRDFQQTQDYMITPAPPSKSFSDDSQEHLPERQKHENSKVIRSRYLIRGRGRRMYAKVTDSD